VRTKVDINVFITIIGSIVLLLVYYSSPRVSFTQ